MKVYVVESGAHEWYLIHGIFSTREKALVFINQAKPPVDKVVHGDFRIEEVELDVPIAEGTLLALGY